MKTHDKEKVAAKLYELRNQHFVEFRFFRGENDELECAEYCLSCGWITEALHTENILLEYMENVYEDALLEEKARAWDKGWAKGARASGITPMRIGYVHPPTKSNRNPYRHRLKDVDSE